MAVGPLPWFGRAAVRNCGELGSGQRGACIASAPVVGNFAALAAGALEAIATVRAAWSPAGRPSRDEAQLARGPLGA
jgi:hypothetical protein